MVDASPTLKFAWFRLSGPQRYALAALLFSAGAIWPLFSGEVLIGGALIILGHVLIWVRKLDTAPGGATPSDSETWAPVDEDWLARVRELEDRGRKWDLSAWDASSGLGCVTFFGVAALVIALIAIGASVADHGLQLAAVGTLLFAPIWLNGMRSNWIPSELRRKGDALEVVTAVLAREKPGAYDVVPLLAMRQGKRGRYPTDARVMLRPTGWGPETFIGIQAQVALNNVRGIDYPYVYFVILVKEGARLPAVKDARDSDIVLEPGSGSDVEFLVVRQYADRSGGWETEPHHIEALLTCALRLADTLK